ncbi:MAG TPA: pyridoxal phosphate-dependent aminotransferase [Thermodesulfobacteriota bacterium]|jgi:aspartate/methionine/tyrosine aminotransferase|nr:pyridoxal phosphate-dependent aminotransferase [Thermodesulfobacteriota bacterium]
MPSRLSEEIAPFYVMDVLERAKEIEARGGRVIHFEVGEPDFPTPRVICDEAIESIRDGDTKYTSSLGILELREAIAEDYRKKHGIEVSPGRIIVTMGSSPALFLTMVSILDPGDEIIITDPHYACYPQLIRIAGGVPKRVRIYEEEGFQIDIRRLKKAISKKTKAILINSPSNPTGVVLDPGLMREISDLGPYVISDEIYHGLIYEGEARTIYEFTDKAFLVNGFSKLYSMTGWRLGYLIAPHDFIRPIQKLQQNLFISANPFVQRAGIVALKKAGEGVKGMVKVFGERRIRMIEGLRELGFKIHSEPKGGFYVFVNARALDDSSYDLAFDILEKAHVAVTPGIDFGYGGEGYLRFSYATSIESIDEGIKRLKRYINGRG